MYPKSSTERQSETEEPTIRECIRNSEMTVSDYLLMAIISLTIAFSIVPLKYQTKPNPGKIHTIDPGLIINNYK